MILNYILRRMEKNSTFNALRDLIEVRPTEKYQKHWNILQPFLQIYEHILEGKGLDKSYYFDLLAQYCTLVVQQIENPHQFHSYHEATRAPIDYMRLGCEIFRPLIDFSKSTLKEFANLHEIEANLQRGENVILFANHQIEADPQVIDLLLEKDFPKLGSRIIFVAGTRVVTDPVAIPFSLGRNLFCICSKKYFSANADQAVKMRQHNQRTISEIITQLQEGGKCIYIAPSGGRDRKGASGEVKVAPFDPQSVELMYLMSNKVRPKTHFYPLALSTHDILPPPEDLQVELGEKRLTKEAPVHAHFGKKIDMENFPLSDTTNKKKRKDARTQYIYQLVCNMYAHFPKFH